MRDALPASKTCRQCKAEKSADQFLPSAFTADGLTDNCKPCVLANSARDRAEREARRATNERTLAHV